MVKLSGTRLDEVETTQEVPVCGPGAFVLLKALACDRRGKDKDKYDLFYMIRNYREGPPTMAEHFQPFLDSGRREAEEAREILRDLFESPQSIGPVAVSQFVYGESDDTLQADATAFVKEFLGQLES
ncbi:nucleotidyl transferase AbiEii/AbiGii toxin family protein [Salinibacter ruber]|uniref:nucleotidyl transferase AbiEii/AbiGii toxin family protein n=1 Tax=Salinibacter ruber TaxID=146919 RepID=UPI000C9F0B8D|nr:nucleotidyl transferase AbiEii/AbiGii toxin family protein [Salinibacter ruber]